MKKFLNYILVAGVAVLGFVGAASAGTYEKTAEDNKVINTVAEKLKALNNTIEVKTVYNTVQGTDSDLKSKVQSDALNEVVKTLTGSSSDRYFLVFTAATTGSEATPAKVTLKRDMTSTITPNATAEILEEYTNVTVKYVDDLTTSPAQKVTDKMTKITDVALNDVEYLQYVLNGSKNGYLYSQEYKDAIKAEGNVSVVATPVKDADGKVINDGNTVQIVVKYNNIIAGVKTITFSAATTPSFYVSEDTKGDEAIKAELESRIKAAVPGKNVTVTYPGSDASHATIYVEGTTIDGTYAVEAKANLKAVTVNATIESNSTDVTVTSDKAVDAGTKLVVKAIENPTELAKAVAKDVKDIVAYDIKLVDASDKEVKFDGVKYTVTVTIPENLTGKKLAAYTIVDGKLEEHEISVDGNKGSFTTTHFSEWIITEVVKVGEDGKVLPNTLDNAASFAFVGVIGLVGMAASALFLNKRN